MELARVALVAPNPEPELLDAAAEGAGRYLFTRHHDARRAHDDFLQPALARLNAMGAAPGHDLLLIACDCAERLGEREAQDRVLAMMEQAGAQGADRAGALLYIARRHQQRGDIQRAQQVFSEGCDRLP